MEDTETLVVRLGRGPDLDIVLVLDRVSDGFDGLFVEILERVRALRAREFLLVMSNETASILIVISMVPTTTIYQTFRAASMTILSEMWSVTE